MLGQKILLKVLYKRLNMNLEYTTISDIPIGLYKDGPVGISVSCGADSAIVLYILMSNIKHDLHIYHLLSHRRRVALEKPFDRVVEKCAELTGKKNFYIHKIPVESSAPEMMFKLYKQSLDTKQVDIIYTGLTKFPPDEIYEQWEDKLPQWHVDLRKESNVHLLFGLEIKIPPGTNCTSPALTIDGGFKDSLTMDTRVYSPFINHNKQDIASLYRALCVEETLFPSTRSCENDNHLESHCGTCWWCNERLWGFGHLE
jgi:hypothetical protein